MMEIFKFLKWSWTHSKDMTKGLLLFFSWDVISLVLCFFLPLSTVYAIWVVGIVSILLFVLFMIIADSVKHEWKEYKLYNTPIKRRTDD